MFTLRHSGRMGDVLYSLYYATHLTQGKPFNFLLRANVRDYCDPSGRRYLMERKDADFMSPLLAYQPYIDRVFIAENEREIPQDSFMLDKFRLNMYGIIGKEIRTWYYGVRENIPPGEFKRNVSPWNTSPSKTLSISCLFSSHAGDLSETSPGHSPSRNARRFRVSYVSPVITETSASTGTASRLKPRNNSINQSKP